MILFFVNIPTKNCFSAQELELSFQTKVQNDEDREGIGFPEIHQLQLQGDARMALAQAKDIAYMQIQVIFFLEESNQTKRVH